MQDSRPPDDPVALFSARLSTAGLSLSQAGALPPPTRPAPSPSLSSPAIFSSTARLPRTSSLLPPPRIASAKQPNGSAHSRGPSPALSSHGRRQSPPPPSVTDDDSYTPTAENFYNLNRWSASTESTNASPKALRRPSTSNSIRRDTVDVSTTLTTSPSAPRSTTRKLQKNRRPSTSRSPSKDHLEAFNGDLAKPSDPPLNLTLPGLPILSPLLNLDQAVPQQPETMNHSQLHTPATERMPSPFTNPDPFAQPPRPSSAAASVALSSATHEKKLSNDHGRQTSSALGHSNAAPKTRQARGSNDSSKTRSSKPPSQKTMLHRALQKANTAVQLDNAHNFEGARQAYSEACDLLQQVLQRTNGEEDKRKLEAIRRTYTSRIDELDQMGPWKDGTAKALPARPESGSKRQSVLRVGSVGNAEAATARLDQGEGVESSPQEGSAPGAAPTQQLPLRSRYNDSRFGSDSTRQDVARPDPPFLQSAFSSSPRRLRAPDNGPLARHDGQSGARPLSPDRSQSPAKPLANGSSGIARTDYAMPSRSPQASPDRNTSRGHMREGSINSWLDPIDESGGSTSSSVHSRTSSLGYRRKHIRADSSGSKAELDAAMDAAIEAAYDDGYEPMAIEEEYEEPSDVIVANALRKVEMARERKRQAEREIAEEEARRQQMLKERFEAQDPEGFFDDNSSEEDERMLEEMTRDLAIEDMGRDQSQRLRHAVPRESDSSGFTSRTYHSSTGSSNPVTGATSFTMTSENKSKTNLALGNPIAPPPTASLPELPPPRPSSAAAQQSVRNRRLSGQKPKDLKIETSRIGPSAPPKNNEEVPRPKTSTAAGSTASFSQPHPSLPRPVSPISADPSSAEPRQLGSPLATRNHIDDDERHSGRAASPSMTRLRKNFSSSSLRSIKTRNMSLSALDDASDMSPGTPASNPMTARTPALPAIPSGMATQAGGTAVSGHFLFATDIHSANSPGIPNPMASTGIVALEPCPTDFMLRPFWLMRCLYQTLVNPRGGYISQKLFVPRDVWRVRGVKLKNLEDKVSNCDLLTAALLKLAKVDSFDADAMLEEMQSLEGVLEQVQANLARKLGNEVGVQGSGMLFKEASSTAETDSGSGVPRSGSVSNKSSSFSWRRLRSKNSAAGLGSSYNTGRAAASGDADGVREVPNLASLPMTPTPTSKPARRDVALAQFTGPYANYMSSLARLFDAAQAVDQIARQVDDPGLRHADTTQVGLELCTRHAAEFFGFYICRFVLSDLGMLLDKFIKRGSEWVLV